MKIKINDLTWKIIEVDTNDTNLLSGNTQCFGTCHYSKQIIYIDKNLNIEKLYQTLIHELTHAFIYCYLLKMNCKFDEEELCEFVAIYGKKIINMATDYFNNRNKVGDINE